MDEVGKPRYGRQDRPRFHPADVMATFW